jgi:hypothetical protein
MGATYTQLSVTERRTSVQGAPQTQDLPFDENRRIFPLKYSPTATKLPSTALLQY